MTERFRWRINPAVVGQYFTGDQLPKNIDVQLKPNEACAVIENGVIVGVASSTRMTLNPELGTLAKLLSKREPFRSFLFAHTGPHELLVPVTGSWSDGTKAQGMAGLKMRFNNEEMGRMLLFPSKGKNTITLGDLSDSIVNEISQKFATTGISSTTQSQARSDSATATLLESKLRNIAQSALADVGGILERVWISWMPSDHERVTAMRQELEMILNKDKPSMNAIAWRWNVFLPKKSVSLSDSINSNLQPLVWSKIRRCSWPCSTSCQSRKRTRTVGCYHQSWSTPGWKPTHEDRTWSTSRRSCFRT